MTTQRYSARNYVLFFCSIAVTALAIPNVVQAYDPVYSIVLDGPSENPINDSLGIGTGTVTFDLDLATLRLQTSFTGLTGNVTAAHIHAATTVAFAGSAGVATQVPLFTGFPIGATSGIYDQTFDMTLESTYNPAYITANGGTTAGAMNALMLAAAEGKAYLNIHSSDSPGGEIRGFLTSVPEPSSLLVTMGTWLAIALRRRKATLIRD